MSPIVPTGALSREPRPLQSINNHPSSINPYVAHDASAP